MILIGNTELVIVTEIKDNLIGSENTKEGCRDKLTVCWDDSESNDDFKTQTYIQTDM